MRLGQLEGKEGPDKPSKSSKPDAETIAVLKGLQQEMHATMLQADSVMRRLAQILDKIIEKALRCFFVDFRYEICYTILLLCLRN